jgi:hypothetical protein
MVAHRRVNLARRPPRQSGDGATRGADPVSRHPVEAVVHSHAGAGDDARRAAWRLARAPASLPPMSGAHRAPFGGAEKDVRWMPTSSPSLRSMDRSFLPRAASPCRLPSFDRCVVEYVDVAASIFGARIASSACVRIRRAASASKLSNGIACATRDDVHDFRRDDSSSCVVASSVVVDGVRTTMRHARETHRKRPRRPRSRRGAWRRQPRAAIGFTGRCASPV